MKTSQNRFIDDFYNVIRMPHDFDTKQERTTLVISRNEEVQEQALQMGATHAAGLEVIKQAQVFDLLITNEHTKHLCLII